MNKQIPLFKVFMSEDVDKPLLETLHSGFIGEGSKVLEFEDTLKKHLQTENVLTTNSGTSALHLAYHIALNPEALKGYEVGEYNMYKFIMSTPITCTATNNPIIHNNAWIRWIDVDPITGNITPKTLKESLDTYKFKPEAIAIVHWGGNPCDIEEISKICKEHDIKLIEDGAHSLGIRYNNKPFGYYSDFAIHSFQAIKHITAGDGGCLICKSKEDYERAKLLRWYGIDRMVREGIDLRCELDIAEAGYKFHMNDIAATIGNENFKHLDEILNKHRENAKYYNEAFNGKIKFAPENPNGKSSYWLYTIHVNNRDELMQKLKEEGIMSSKVHSRNDTHTAFSEFKRDLPGVESFNKTHLCIPVGWWVTEEDREFIAKKVLEYAK
ncbi:MAG: DegT/DnrJ/EryC1/StrS family aminotransferase [Bacilli bacterium]|nr:DegT/DnrJ/EryC1/StrS family aminotransferase [Bacilli bacterium]